MNLFISDSCFVLDCSAVFSDEILVAVNAQKSGSVEIVDFYMEKRKNSKSQRFLLCGLCVLCGERICFLLLD